jgi:hypothetical protein
MTSIHQTIIPATGRGIITVVGYEYVPIPIPFSLNVIEEVSYRIKRSRRWGKAVHQHISKFQPLAGCWYIILT